MPCKKANENNARETKQFGALKIDDYAIKGREECGNKMVNFELQFGLKIAATLMQHLYDREVEFFHRIDKSGFKCIVILDVESMDLKLYEF